MYGIDILYTEHENVVRFTDFIRELCAGMLSGKEADKALLRECVDFMHEYADEHHHGKEEAILFQVMLEKLGPVAAKMINTGMLVEHNLGRYHVQSLREAVEAMGEEPAPLEKVDVVTHLLGYADLLRRHAQKENGVLFPFAAKNLSPEDMEKVNEATRAYEEEGAKNGMGKYVEWLDKVFPVQ